MMIKLDNTDNNIENLINMARELNVENGSEEWSDAFSLADDVDEYLADMKPSEIMRAMFFGNIDCDDYINALVRFNAYGNFEIIDTITLDNEAWDYRNEILDNYKDTFGDEAFDKAIAIMDVIQ